MVPQGDLGPAGASRVVLCFTVASDSPTDLLSLHLDPQGQGPPVQRSVRIQSWVLCQPDSGRYETNFGLIFFVQDTTTPKKAWQLDWNALTNRCAVAHHHRMARHKSRNVNSFFGISWDGWLARLEHPIPPHPPPLKFYNWALDLRLVRAAAPPPATNNSNIIKTPGGAAQIPVYYGVLDWFGLWFGLVWLGWALACGPHLACFNARNTVARSRITPSSGTWFGSWFGLVLLGFARLF